MRLLPSPSSSSPDSPQPLPQHGEMPDQHDHDLEDPELDDDPASSKSAKRRRTGLKRRIGLKRSRLGCLQCRRRRKKCSYEKPVCSSCLDRAWDCTYPAPTDEHSQKSVSPSPISTASPESSHIGIVSHNNNSSSNNNDSTNSLDLFSSVLSDDGSEPHMFDEVVSPNVSSLLTLASSAAVSAMHTPPQQQQPQLPEISMPSTPMNNLDGFDPLSILSFTREQKELVYHFTVSISSVISYYKQEGPFRRLILSLLIPVSTSGSASAPMTGPLLSSLCALASAHKNYALGLAHSDQQLSYHTGALENLITLLENLPTRLEDENTQNVLLSSILILVYYEIAKGGYIDSISMHLNGAYRIITSFLNHVIFKLQASSGSGQGTYQVSKETIFLFRIFQYFDVICSLSKRDLMLDRTLQLEHFLSTYSRLKTTSNIDGDGVDPVIGLAEDLWPLIVRLCILCNDSDFGKSMTPDLMCRASLLELELSSWQVPTQASAGASPHDLAMQAAAKVYQLAAQIYLLRTFFPAENAADTIQGHVRSALDQLARVCTLEGNMAALLWPVSVVANECVDSIDRGFVKVVFQKLGKRQGMANVMRGLHSVEASWRGVEDREVVMFG
ncbi:fungal-specific transcription factor domain-containing protein [Myxozyma melibiosi]|uniref:Fungal-specific transcription factor domain-containing protein n=1 Tax=Myxozyma melibiosi TaxID=54550 RepID=A0ABR1F339_9ASCO